MALKVFFQLPLNISWNSIGRSLHISSRLIFYLSRALQSARDVSDPHPHEIDTKILHKSQLFVVKFSFTFSLRRPCVASFNTLIVCRNLKKREQKTSKHQYYAIIINYRLWSHWRWLAVEISSSRQRVASNYLSTTINCNQCAGKLDFN